MLHPCRTQDVLRLLMMGDHGGGEGEGCGKQGGGASLGGEGRPAARCNLDRNYGVLGIEPWGLAPPARTCASSTGSLGDDVWLLRYMVAWFSAVISPALGVVLSPYAAAAIVPSGMPSI